MPKSHATFFKMLSARSRVQILKLLREHDDLTVDDLAGKLDIGVTTVSRHLQLLRMQNLVTFEQDAQNRYYSVNAKAIAQGIAAFLRELGISLSDA
jgi:DNA-binding transcriptional ArsR family regulator